MPAPTRPNPYAPQPANLPRRGKGVRTAGSGRRVPARRSTRILAHGIDVLMFVAVGAVGALLMLFAGDVGFWVGLGVLVVGALILIVLQIIFLVRGSATIGMYAMKID